MGKQQEAVSVPSSLTGGKSLVIIPQKAYKEFLKWRQRLEQEKEDTDKAIKIFKKEYAQGKLKQLKSLRELR